MALLRLVGTRSDFFVRGHAVGLLMQLASRALGAAVELVERRVAVAVAGRALLAAVDSRDSAHLVRPISPGEHRRAGHDHAHEPAARVLGLK